MLVWLQFGRLGDTPILITSSVATNTCKLRFYLRLCCDTSLYGLSNKITGKRNFSEVFWVQLNGAVHHVHLLLFKLTYTVVAYLDQWSFLSYVSHDLCALVVLRFQLVAS